MTLSLSTLKSVDVILWCYTLRAVWAGVRKIVSDDNRSIFVTQFASKINCQVCCQMAWVSRETSQEQEKEPFFKFFGSSFLDGFGQLSVEVTFRTTAHTAEM